MISGNRDIIGSGLKRLFVCLSVCVCCVCVSVSVFVAVFVSVSISVSVSVSISISVDIELEAPLNDSHCLGKKKNSLKVSVVFEKCQGFLAD